MLTTAGNGWPSPFMGISPSAVKTLFQDFLLGKQYTAFASIFASALKSTLYFLYMSTLSDNIKRLRKGKGWTQIDLAEKLDTNQQAITAYETGQRKPPIDRLAALAAVFGISVDELLSCEPVEVKETAQQRHGNSRVAQVQEYFEKLSEEEQRTTLKQIKALADKR